MHLKSLTLRGFKSFASATTLKFEPGICAVVGPNGSGKSNVVDALTWVMGEQGAKNLRGGSMQDVIFAGAGQRKPLGRAEVTLTIDNSDGALPIDYREVSLTRRVFRDGASEYEINGSRARLLDVQELLSDSGIGREMHVIVGQGRLAEILESRPNDRRSYIEEAAGVLKHRRRREKAQRKLVNMQANVDRLSDLTEELGKQLAPLARQADAARRAHDVQAQLRAARLTLAADRILRLQRAFEDAHAQHAHLAEELSHATAEKDEEEKTLIAAEAELADATLAAEAAHQLWFDLTSLHERVDATHRVANERAAAVTISDYQGPDPAELDAAAERLEREHNEANAAVEIARETLAGISVEVAERSDVARAAERDYVASVRAHADRRAGMARLVAAEESLLSQLETARAEADRSAEDIDAAAERVAEAQETVGELAETTRAHATSLELAKRAFEQAEREFASAHAREKEVRAQQQGAEKELYSLQARLEALEASRPAPPPQLSDWEPVAGTLSADPGIERAVAAALGEVAEGLVGPEFPDTHALRDAARAVYLVPLPARRWRLDASLPSGATWLLDHLTLPEAVAAALTRLLVDVVLCADVAAARRVVEEDPRLRAVTSDGTLVGEGWVSVGHGGRSAVEVEAEIAATRAALEQAHAALTAIAGTADGAARAADEARVGVAAARADVREQDALGKAHRAGAEQAHQQLRRAQAEYDKVAARLSRGQTRVVELEQELADVRLRRERLPLVGDDPADIDTSARDAAALALEQVKVMEVEARLALRTAEERAAQSRSRSEGVRRQACQERVARQRYAQMMEARLRRARVAATVATLAVDLRSRVAAAMSTAADTREAAVARKNAAATRAAQTRDRVKAVRVKLDRITEAAHASEIARSQAAVRKADAEQKIGEELGIALGDLLAQWSPSEGFDRTAEQARLKEAQRALAALGKVNPLALEEYAALEKRYQFLSTQLADVTSAQADLEGVIKDVDAKIVQLFHDAWIDVEREFPKVFSTLFPGGEARLVLTDPHDMLTTGIEVEARPPGKKIQRLSLLSGGEKSLTALALLVAIFRARPSPFYVMDEVEAALDDVNLRRLLALFRELRRDSQLIVITHQKPTMDEANVLYGVTMRGDGITRVISQRMNPASASDELAKP